ncbi:carbohydrate-binding protein [Promicromonospora sp. NPDC057488]|uniref:carbohydrate-binding protein n=1 Tax=Promicromonospora sp. NPDC057488 TaxID=3346147 RepID=UPI0036703EF9
MPRLIRAITAPLVAVALAASAVALTPLAATAAPPPASLDAPTDPRIGDVTGDVLSLNGSWEFKTGGYATSDPNGTLSESVLLPGTMGENEKGNPDGSSSIDRLTSLYNYVGAAVYQRRISIPADWSGKQITLFMERTKDTRVWLNGVEQTAFNSKYSYGTPHEYYLTGIRAGEVNTITIEVNNSITQFTTDNHMITRETQTNWNGIIGKFELVATAALAIRDVRVYPDLDQNAALVNVAVANASSRASSFPAVSITGESYNGTEGEAPAQIPAFTGAGGTVAAGAVQSFSYSVPMGDNVKLWSEWTPNLYDLEVSIPSASYETSFGMREFSAGGPGNRHFTINGDVTFLRGEANSAVFPLTGYPYMTKQEWRKFFGKAQDLGINFFRFHSWSPPEAAFAAADELGIYMQPELYRFGGRLDANYEPNRAEAELIAKHLANHPSYVAMTWGNEVTSTAGASRDASNRLRTFMRELDPTRLYAEGTNANLTGASLNTGDDFWATMRTEKDAVRMSFSYKNEGGGGFLESMQPNSSFTMDTGTAGYNMPIMGHETGQYENYPDFSEEIPKYRTSYTDSGGVVREGKFEARNLSRYQSMAAASGLSDMEDRFALASTRLAATAYKADIEANIRTSEMAGYQLLSIQDFPGQQTALVGILDIFMDEKIGGLASSDYRAFNDDVSLLGKLDTFVYTNDQDIEPTVTIANYGSTDLADLGVSWTLGEETLSIDGKDVVTDKGDIIASGDFTIDHIDQGVVRDVKDLSIDLSSITKPTKLVLRLKAESGFTGSNFYNVWVYPAAPSTTVPSNVYVTRTWDQAAKDRLAAGGRVLFVPKGADIPNSVQVGWRPDYWSKYFHLVDPNYDRPKRTGVDSFGKAYTKEDAYTLGAYIDADHPVFDNFPTEFFSDAQWYNLVRGSRAIVMDSLPADQPVIAENIDHINRHHRLASLFEAKVGAGSLMVSSFDLFDKSHPEITQLYSSMLDYMGSADFAPSYTGVSVAALDDMFDVSNDGYAQFEAERYDVGSRNFKTETGTTVDGKAATVIGGVVAGDYITYKARDFLTGSKSITLNGANASSTSAAAVIQVRKGGPTGTLLSTINFAKTGSSWTSYVSRTFDLTGLEGVQDLTLVFVNGSIALNYIQLTKAPYAYSKIESESYTSAITGARLVTDRVDGTSTTETVVDGPVGSGPWTTHTGVKFGSVGTREFVLNGINSRADGLPVQVELRDGGISGTLISTVDFESTGDGPGDALHAESQRFTIPRITGTKDITIVAKTAGLQLNHFSFVEIPTTDPYAAIDPRSNPDLELVGSGSSFEALEIGGTIQGSIRLPYTNGQFGDAGAAALEMTLGSDEPVKVTLVTEGADGVEIPLTAQPRIGYGRDSQYGENHTQFFKIDPKIVSERDFSLQVEVPAGASANLQTFRFLGAVPATPISSVEQPDGITVPKGTTDDELRSQLPDRIELTANGAAVSASVDWDEALPETVTEPVAVQGKVALPTGFTANGVSLDVELNVDVAAGVPDAPAKPAAVAEGDEVRVQWAAPANNGGSAITGYTVTLSGGPAPITRAVDGEATSVTITAVASGVYSASVVATNALGDSPSSAPSEPVTVGSAVKFEVVVEARCVASKVLLAVTVKNQDTGPIAIALESAYGAKNFAVVGADKSVFHSFTTRLNAVPAGELIVTATAQVQGTSKNTRQALSYPAKTC